MRNRITTLLVALALVATVTTASAQNVPEILYLQFNEGSGTTTADMAFPGVAGTTPTLIGAATWQPVGAILGASALRMPPTATTGDSCITTAPISFSGDWTIECYVFLQMGAGTTTRYILGDATSTSLPRIYVTSGTQVNFAGTGFNFASAPGTITENTWHHIAVVYDSAAGTIDILVDGTLITDDDPQPTGATFNWNAGAEIGGAGTLSRWVGAIDEVRVWNRARTQTEIQANMMNELMLVSDDLGVTLDALPTPMGCDLLGSAVPLSFTATNAGTNSIPAGTLISVDVTIDGGAPINETFLTSAVLNTGDTENFSLMTTADLSAIGPHTVSITHNYTPDLDPSNNTSSDTTFSGGNGLVQTFPWLETFDGSIANQTTTPPTGWEQDQTDGGGTGGDLDWYFRNTQTSSTNTGPVGGADHTSGTGYFAYVEDSSGNHPQINLDTPCIDLGQGTLSNPRLIFFTHSYNNSTPTTSNENFLSVDIFTYPGAVVTMDVFGPYGHDSGNANYASSDWRLQSVDLSPFNLQTIRVRFRGRSDGGSFTHDIAIDDVSIGDVQSGNGQPGRPGLALLDVNNAQNAFFGQGGPASGDNGPFVTTGTLGANLDFTFNGEPNIAFAWLVGTLNEGSATFPGTIGQFDIGMTLDPNTGIPVDIGVIGDGFNPFDFVSSLCRTDAAGDAVFSLLNSGLAPGFQATFQCAFQSTTDQGGGVFPAFIAMSNAVELTIQ